MSRILEKLGQTALQNRSKYGRYLLLTPLMREGKKSLIIEVDFARVLGCLSGKRAGINWMNEI